MQNSQYLAGFVPKLNAVFKTTLTCLGISIGTVGFLQVMSLSALADVVGNQGIRFGEDTIVEFEFIESHGAYQSTFGVINLDSCQKDGAGAINFESCSKTPLMSEVKASDSFDTVYRRSTYETDLQEGRNNDFLGTPGNTVPNYKEEFLFEANQRYVFYLESQFDGKTAGVVYSSDLINSRGNRQALFNNEGLTKDAIATRRNTDDNTNKFDRLVDGGLLINFDDTGSNLVKTSDEDADFDDFVVGMGGGIICDYGDTDHSK